MMSDGRLRLPQDRRKQARVLLQQLQQPLYPAWNTGFFQAYDLSARNWLLALIHDYDQALPRIQQILRDATDTMARITALHVEYPDIPCGKLQDMLQQALRKDGIRLRPAFLAEAIMAWQYGSESLHAIRKALTRARTVQRLEAALGTHRATLAPPA
jgi:hypothetical protein